MALQTLSQQHLHWDHSCHRVEENGKVVMDLVVMDLELLWGLGHSTCTRCRKSRE